MPSHAHVAPRNPADSLDFGAASNPVAAVNAVSAWPAVSELHYGLTRDSLARLEIYGERVVRRQLPRLVLAHAWGAV